MGPARRLRLAAADAVRALGQAVSSLAFRAAAWAAGPARPSPTPLSLRRIAVLHVHAIGDLLMATPAIRALARRHPGARIDVICRTHWAELLRYNPHVHHVRPLLRPPHRRTPGGLLEFAGHLAFLRRGRYDAVVDMSGLGYTAWLTYGSGAPIRIGIAPPGFRAGAVWPLYTAANEREPRQHFIEEYLAVAALLDAPPAGEGMDLMAGEEARQAVDRWLARAGLREARLAVVHPGAKWAPKRWPAERFATIARWLASELALTPILAGGPEDAPVVEAMARAAGPFPIFDSRLGLLGLAALLERAALFVGNDSGPMHMARAVGTPTIGIFGPTQPERSGPRGQGAEAILAPIECRPCRLYYTADRCERGHNYCMDDVSVAVVQVAARRLVPAGAGAAPAPFKAPLHGFRAPAPAGRPAGALTSLPGARLGALAACRAVEALARARRPLAIVLCYHRVVPNEPDDLTPPGLCVRRDDFERQLDHLQARSRFLAPSELLAELSAGRLVGPAVALTFDDGFRDNADVVAPILRARGLRAAFFVVPEHVGHQTWMWHNRVWRASALGESPYLTEPAVARAAIPMDSRRLEASVAALETAAGLPPPPATFPFMMTWEDLRRLQADGHEIGAHTLTHAILARCPPEERRRQIRGSKAAIEATLGDRVRLFSYPFGQAGTWDAEAVAEVRAAGFDYAFTTAPATVDPLGDPWSVPRIPISRDDGILGFQVKRLAPVYLRHLLRLPTRNGWWGNRDGRTRTRRSSSTAPLHD